MKNKSKQFRRFALTLFVLFRLSCTKTPSGPDIPELTTASVFCILDPSLTTQRLLLQSTLSFRQAQDNSARNEAEIRAHISLTSADQAFTALRMGASSEKFPKDYHFGADFPWGSGQFNYVFSNCSLQPGQFVQLLADTQEFGSIKADIVIPDTFTLACTSPTFVDVFDHKIADNIFTLAWSQSKGAEGYLLDISLVEYDVDKVWPIDNFFGPKAENFQYYLSPPDSSPLVAIPYKEHPVYFAQRYGNKARGVLSRDNSFNMPLNKLLNSTASNIFQQHWWSFYFIRATVYALDRNAYNYTAFQYLNFGDEKFIGQQAAIPDLGNIENGKGILGAAVSRTIFKRVTDLNSPTPIDYDPYDGDPLIQPPNAQVQKTVDVRGDSVLNISWTKVPDMPWYIIAIRSKYLWFSPARLIFLTQELSIDVPYSLFPLRDADIEIVVRGLSFITEDGDSLVSIIDVPPFNSSVVVDGHVGVYAFWENDSHGKIIKTGGYLAEKTNHATPWSEPITIHTAGGELSGFEQLQPRAAANNIQWQPVQGADAYLVYARNESGAWAAAVTRETNIAPPFETPIESIEGARTLPVASGEKLNWRVQALRLKTGGLGFAIEKEPAELPKVYPRYKHPSGIMLCSLWSEERNIVTP